MLQIRSTLAAIAACIAVAACAAQVQNKENMLAAAGFTVVPANTPERQTSLASLPPHKFVRQTRNNMVVFIYADPTICDCLYVGNQAAYDRYRSEVFAKNLANEQQLTAQINEMNWGPWDPAGTTSVVILTVQARSMLSLRAKRSNLAGILYQCIRGLLRCARNDREKAL